MRHKTEAEIQKNWREQALPVVSIICQTYNHQNYIGDAIVGFLQQETDFPFEIIIHDDASTDETPNIVKQYADQYPNIIRTVLQTENQNSQYRKNSLLSAAACVRGKYVAICDGDDFWIDSHKLNVQVSAMSQHPECQISFHPVFHQIKNERHSIKTNASHYKHGTIVKTQEVIFSALSPTSSLMLDADIFRHIPEWFLDVPVGDYFLKILGSLKGGALFLDRAMTVYRVYSTGSWSARFERDGEYLYEYTHRMLQSLEDINVYTHYRYQRELNIMKRKVCFATCIHLAVPLEKRQKLFQENKYRFTIKNKIICYVAFKNGKLIKKILNILRR